VYGLDVSKEALDIASGNAELLNINVTWLQTDLLGEGVVSNIPEAEVWVSNPPYVLQSEAGDMDEAVTLHEPALALFVPDDEPLLFYWRLSELALKNDQLPRALFVELHPDFSEAVVKLWSAQGWDRVIPLNDMHGKKRMAGAFRHSGSS
jgi:release factor glutamine methyltransferase